MLSRATLVKGGDDQCEKEDGGFQKKGAFFFWDKKVLQFLARGKGYALCGMRRFFPPFAFLLDFLLLLPFSEGVSNHHII